jgi:hypothetical protein
LIADGGGIVATSRANVTGSQFNETPVESGPIGAAKVWFTWGDLSGNFTQDNFHFTNPTTSSMSLEVTFGSYVCYLSLAAGAASYCPFKAGTFGGPVVVYASGPVIASERQTYGQSFNEVNAASYP